MFKKKNSENIIWVIPFLIYSIYLFIILSHGYTDTYYASFGLNLSFLDNPAEIYFFYGLKAFVVEDPKYCILLAILLLSVLPFIAFVLAKKINRFLFNPPKIRLLLNPPETQGTGKLVGILALIRKHEHCVKLVYWALFVLLFFSLFILGTVCISKLGENHARKYIAGEIHYANHHVNPYNKRRQPFEPNKAVFLKKKSGDSEESCYRLLHMDSSGLYVYREPARYELIQKEDHQDQRTVNVDLLFFPTLEIDQVRFGDRLLVDEKCIPEGWEIWKDLDNELPAPGVRFKE